MDRSPGGRGFIFIEKVLDSKLSEIRQYLAEGFVIPVPPRKADKPIGPGTVAKILGFSNAVSIDGKSQLSGIDDATAFGLESMRLQLKPVFAALADDGVTKSQVAMAYTFRTQGFLSQAVQLKDYLKEKYKIEPAAGGAVMMAGPAGGGGAWKSTRQIVAIASGMIAAEQVRPEIQILEA